MRGGRMVLRWRLVEREREEGERGQSPRQVMRPFETTREREVADVRWVRPGEEVEGRKISEMLVKMASGEMRGAGGESEEVVLTTAAVEYVGGVGGRRLLRDFGPMICRRGSWGIPSTMTC